MRGLMASRSTGRTATHGKTVQIQVHHHGLTLHATHTQRRGIGQPFFGLLSKKGTVRNDRTQHLFQMTLQMSQPEPLFCQGGLGQCCGQTTPHDTRQIFRPGTPSTFLPAPHQKGLQCNTFINDQCPHPFGTTKLMRRQSHHIDRQPLQTDGNPANTLYGIRVQAHRGRATALCNFRKRLNHAGFIVGVHDGHQHRIRSYRRQNMIRRDTPLRIHTHPGDIHASVLKLLTRFEDRGVLYRTGDHMSPETVLSGRSKKGHIVGFGTAAGKNHLTVMHIQQGRHTTAGLIHPLSSRPTGPMHGGRVARPF